MSDAMTYDQVMRRWKADGEKIRSLKEEVAKLEAELEMYERDETFGTLAIQLANLEEENKRLRIEYGLLRIAFGASGQSLDAFDALLKGEADETE